MNYCRLCWCCFTLSCVAVGAAGAVLPLLPTTPFLLLAAWAAPKSSPRLERWLHEHPRFGPPLAAWRRERAIAKSAKITALVVMMLSWLSLWWWQAPAPVLAAVGVLLAVVGMFIVTRPTPSDGAT